MRLISLFFVLGAVVLPFAATAQSLEFELLDAAPKAVTHPYGNIAIQPLLDGRLLIWDGDALYVQEMVGGTPFREIASGYAGDTGFMAVSPDGHTVVLGAGMSGKLYKFDVSAPADYSASADLGVISHYWGVFLNDTLLLIDKLTDDYSTDELVIVDVSESTLDPRRVMLKPDATEVPSGGFAASAGLAVDRTRTNVYTMGVVYNATFTVVANPLKRIAVSDLIAAYTAEEVLDWNTDAVTIGGDTTFSSGGPMAVTNDGDVLIAGFGGLAQVDTATASVVETYSPAGAVYQSGTYNPSTGDIIVLATDTAEYTMDLVYLPKDAVQPLPAVGAPALALLALLVALRAAKKLK